jgi:hypothetical protein
VPSALSTSVVFAAVWFSTRHLATAHGEPAGRRTFLQALLLVALGLRKRWLSSGEASFSVLALLIPYLTRGYEMGVGSMGRFVSVAFPTYLVLRA